MELVIGAILVILLGLSSSKFLERKITKPDKPKNFNDEQWELFTSHTSFGAYIGFFERLLFLLAFSINEFTIIAGWLAFKLAAKWEVWKNIIQVPYELSGIDPLDLFQARQLFGSWLFSRFIIGTITNILIGGISFYLSEVLYNLIF